jgi:hypothetical protein
MRGHTYILKMQHVTIQVEIISSCILFKCNIVIHLTYQIEKNEYDYSDFLKECPSVM